MPIDPGTATVIQGASSAAGGALGMIGQRKRATRQHRRQKELMGIQFDNQKALNEQGAALQLQQWKDTNYPAQMEMIKEAGLNPAMLYGMGGSGGATTGSQGGGNAASGSAAAPMDIGSVISASKAAAEIALLTAQKEKTESETNVIDGTNERGRLELGNLSADIENKDQQRDVMKAEERYTNISSAILEGQSPHLIKRAEYEAENLIQEILQAKIETEISERTKESRIATVIQNQINLETQNAVMISQKNLNEEQRKKVAEETSVIFKDFLLRKDLRDLTERRTLNEQEVQAAQRILMKQTGEQIDAQIIQGYWGKVNESVKVLTDLLPSNIATSVQQLIRTPKGTTKTETYKSTSTSKM